MKRSSTKGAMLLFGDRFLSRGMTWGLPLGRYLKTSLNTLVFRTTSFDVGPIDSVSHRL